jgi:hypothetical protein
MSLRDKNGRQIERGDVLKVFHFTGSRNKRHYMYKQAIGVKTLSGETEYMMFSHLDLDDKYYVERCDGRSLADYEIVQSIDAKFEDRPRLSPAITQAHRDTGGAE